MRLTNLDIWNARGALQIIVNQKWPVMVSYRLAKMANKLNEQLKVIEEVRQGLIRKYATPNEDENESGISVKPGEALEQFNKEFNALMEIENKFDVEVVRLPQKVASTCDACHHNMDRDLEIEPIHLMALEKLVEVIE